MTISVDKVELESILPLRALFLQEANRQIRYNACHERGWSDSYLLTINDRAVGYGSVKGREIPDRDTVFEFFVIPPFRKFAVELFRWLLDIACPRFIECQSNIPLLSSLLHGFARNISADVVLFEDHCVTDLSIPGTLLRPKRTSDQIFSHAVEPVGEYVLELEGEILATGGFLLHYNHPFAGLYMEVREDCRRRGLGSFLLQEVKRGCYLAGRVPAARSSILNTSSHAALCRAGLRVSGFMLNGEVKP
jgi:hypothetical protein